MSGLVANVWRLFVFVVAGAIVLGMLGINLTPLLASATIIGATLGFGAQQIVRDYFSGVLMTMEDQYNVGDSVTVGGVTGVIEDVTMRLTRFRGVDGTIYVIPNGDIRLVGNLSRGWARAVVDLTLPGSRRRTWIGCVGDREAAHGWRNGPSSPGTCTEPPQLVGLLAADATTITMRVMLLTVPSQRDPLDPGAARGGDRRAGPGGAVAGRRSAPAGGARRPRADPPARSGRRPPRPPATWPRPGSRAGPQHQLRRRLVDEHAQAVERRGARGRRPPSQGVGRGT